MGNLNHRNEKTKERLDFYLNTEESDIRSCFYHIGKTTTDTIFFISDVIPIKEIHIDREYLGFNNIHYVIKNKKLISELERKYYILKIVNLIILDNI